MNPFNLPLREATSLDVIYETIGEDGISRVVQAFYRQVPSDDVLSPMYPEDDLNGSEERLRDFLVYRFGGPPRYIEERGHPRLRMRHAPFPIDQRARDRWISLMDNAVDAAALPTQIDATLKEFFRKVATFLINRDTSA
ncbi:MAG: globin [Candidatus Tectomicrobia bacterium]|nr:globin [Candidatus Tectomicrobia bacterium]